MRKILLAGKRINYNNFIGCVLLEIFGLNWHYVKYILGLCGLNFNMLIKDIPIILLNSINSLLKLNFLILIILFKQFKNKIRFKMMLGSYRGLRLKFGLPVRGQRTHSNAKTAKKRLI